ncbi:NAD(P)/FAD-dependent oxidoreductase [Cupriavidus sp. TMH.W2]|uniref:NAD(P)/FAD-dependent oxidoreductase n=1 Tax=Cupriavidus sp. TMH.W2 TaxID=3434465 RepID=UPI003D7841A1
MHSGSLKVARRPEDGEVLEEDLVRGKRHGLDVALIEPEEANRLNPFLQVRDVVAILRIGDDMYFNPAQLAIGFARAAQSCGVELLPNMTANRVLMEAGRVTGVETPRSNRS